VTIKVEGFEQGNDGGDEFDGDDEPRGNDDEEIFDDCDDLDDEPEGMDTDKKMEKGANFKTSVAKQSTHKGAKTVMPGTRGTWMEDMQKGDCISHLYEDKEEVLDFCTDQPGAVVLVAEDKDGRCLGQSQSRAKSVLSLGQHMEDQTIIQAIYDMKIADAGSWQQGAEVVSPGGLIETDRDLIQQGDSVVEEMVTDGMLDIKHDSMRSESDGLYETELLQALSAGRPLQRGASVDMNQSELNCLSVINEIASSPKGQMSDDIPSNQDSLDEDNMQTKKWAELIKQRFKEYCVEGIDLLRAMEQSVDEEFSDQENEINELLPEEVVENISKVKESRLCMELCDKRKSTKPA
jgi:hypothetical protein